MNYDGYDHDRHSWEHGTYEPPARTKTVEFDPDDLVSIVQGITGAVKKSDLRALGLALIGWAEVQA